MTDELTAAQFAYIKETLVRIEHENNDSHDRMEAEQKITNAQVKITNGRVSKLELWRAGIAGGVIVILGFCSVVGWLISTGSHFVR